MKCDVCGWVWPEDEVSCRNCGRVFKVMNSTPLLGKNANTEYNSNIANNQRMSNVEYGQNEQYMRNNSYQNYYAEDQKKGLSEGMKCIFIIPLIAAILAFVLGMIGWGIALGICGVILFPTILEKASKGTIIGMIVITVIIAFLAVDDYMYQQEVIDYVKEYKSQDAVYSVGKFFEILECDADWTYEEKEDGEYVSVSFDYYGDSYEIIFKIGRQNVDSSPLILSEVLMNGKEDIDAYFEFYFRLFGE